MMKKRRVPERWEKYLPMGCRVPGTRFLPFKVPLKPELCRNQPEDERFTPSVLLENTPMLKAIIDLTNTNRYYNSEEFTSKGVVYKKINVFGGGKIPPKKICEEFFDAVDQLSRTLDHDSDALIGVHCTHGLNRTGYLICKYMVLRMKIDPQEAINKFQEARGYEIERKNYVSDIFAPTKTEDLPIERNTFRRSATPESSSLHWRTDPRPSCSRPSVSKQTNLNWRNECQSYEYSSPANKFGYSRSVLDSSDYNDDNYSPRRRNRSYRKSYSKGDNDDRRDNRFERRT